MTEQDEIITESDWEPLLNHHDYEICRIYPYSIRRVRDKKVLKETFDEGYVCVSLNQKKYLKHRLIALQFIPNSNTELYTCIDHINHVKNDNRIENLFWCSNEENQNNLSGTRYGRKIIYLDELPEDVIYVDHYNHHRFQGYYFSLQRINFIELYETERIEKFRHIFIMVLEL